MRDKDIVEETFHRWQLRCASWEKSLAYLRLFATGRWIVIVTAPCGCFCYINHVSSHQAVEFSLSIRDQFRFTEEWCIARVHWHLLFFSVILCKICNSIHLMSKILTRTPLSSHFRSLLPFVLLIEWIYMQSIKIYEPFALHRTRVSICKSLHHQCRTKKWITNTQEQKNESLNFWT